MSFLPSCSTLHRFVCRRVRRAVCGLGVSAAVLANLVAMPVAQAQATYSIAIVPQFGAQQLLQEWQPLLKRVGEAAGLRFNLRFYPGIPAFETGFMRGDTDFVFLNPYHAVMARRTQDYQPLVRDETALTGILVVAAGSPIKSLRELDGQKIAFPAPNSFGASLYMRALLAEVVKIRIEPAYVNTHLNVYRMVALGDVAAGGGINATLDDQPAELRARLRVLYTTPATASHPLVAHPRVAAPVRRAVQDAIIALTRDAAGRALLADARMPRPVAADYDRDYAPLEALKLDKYLVFGQ